MPRETELSPAQLRALARVSAFASGAPLDRALRISVHFHPDRLFAGEPLLVVMARDGGYRGQFETRTSNGGLTAHPGGARWSWESRIFGGAYDEASPAERPKYGALNHRGRPTGGSPRFGSAHLRLREATLDRATFCYPDSFHEPADFGVAARMGLAALADADGRDRLDDYIEAHVHGELRFARDVEALVLDPCYADTDVERAARALPCPLEWHPGFRLTVDELARHASYRGPEYVALGAAIAEGGVLDPRIIGDAARTGRHDEQALKRVWHCVARFGARDAGRASALLR
jgi:hypothetical protein